MKLKSKARTLGRWLAWGALRWWRECYRSFLPTQFIANHSFHRTRPSRHANHTIVGRAGELRIR